MDTLSKLSSADWPTKPTLHNLNLLKRYLTFVSMETDIDFIDQNQIEFTLSNQTDLITPESTHQLASRLGATLIEMSVHDPLDKMEPPKGKGADLFMLAFFFS